MKVEFVDSSFAEVKADALILALTREDVEAAKKGIKSAGFAALFGEGRAQIDTALKGSDFAGNKGQKLVIYSAGKSRMVVLVGIGQKAQVTLETLRRAAGIGVKAVQDANMSSVILSTLNPTVQQVSDYDAVHSLIEGGVLAAYKFDKYLTLDKKGKVREFTVALKEVGPDIGRRAARDAASICDAVFLTRDLCNAPANEVYPVALAGVATKVAREFGLRSRVFDERQIKQMKMGGLLAVNSGSSKPPRFITLEYRGDPSSKDWYAIVGKGITFDSGGISLKPAANMGEMKMDMSGAAAVIGTMQAVASLKIPINVVGLAPSTENLPGGSAYKPGDVLTTMSGITIEVDNTDAEGRIILSDALFYAQRYKPKAIIDLATLTGACVVALGQHATGMFGTSEDIMAQIKDAGEKTFERVWQLPLFDEYDKQIKSDIADVKNVGGRWAGAITAAMFLKKFVGGYPWVHLDIAGTAMLEEATDYAPKGGSGVGVRLLTQFFKQVAS